MDEHTTSNDSERAAAIARLIEDVRSARASGMVSDDETIIEANSELMPELADELRKLKHIEAARAAADRQGTSTREPDYSEADLPSLKIPGYSMLRELSRGGQGVVYLASQLSTGRKVAIKVLRDGALADERKLARFRREVQVLAVLNHPNIVTIIDTGQSHEGRYIVMNYVGGMDLAEYMKRCQAKDPEDPSELLRLFSKICDGVDAAHQKGIIHRDLKPGNIRVDDRGEPHILDFGLARTPLDRLANSSNQPLSITGEFMGSLPWSSPEQAEGNPDLIDIRSDVYSLGVILYQMLTGGRFPYEVVGNIREILNNIATVNPTPPSQMLATIQPRDPRGRTSRRKHPSAINETIERIVIKALAKQRERRYQSAGELKCDIATYLLGRPMSAREHSLSPRPFVNPRLRSAIVICLLAVAVGGGLIFRHISRPHAIARVDDGASIINTQMQSGPERVVDLIPLVNINDDIVRGVGHWTRERGSIDFDGKWNDGALAGGFRVPYAPPVEYDLRLRFTFRTTINSLNLLARASGHPFQALVEHVDGNKFDCSIRGWRDEEAIQTKIEIESEQAHLLILHVRKECVTMDLDGRKVGQCRTTGDYIGGPPPWTWVGDEILGLYANHAVGIEAFGIVELGGQGEFLRPSVLGEPPALNIPLPGDAPERVVNLMPLIDPNVDSIVGKWTRVGDQLRCDGNSEATRLQIRYHPPEEYNLCVTFTRTAGVNDVVLDISHDEANFVFKMMDACCTFGVIAGGDPNNNATTVRSPAMLRNGRAYTAIIYVRKGYVAASINGQMIAKYKTDYSNLGPQPMWKFPPRMLGLGTNWSEATFSRLEIVEIAGEGHSMTPADVKAAREMPSAQ